MFRRLESSLPKDFFFPADLNGLGYYVNDKDEIRSLESPDQGFHYFISKNERCVEMQREAMNTCIRREVISRLLASPMVITRLPTAATKNENHVPVLTSTNLSTANRVIVYIGESCQDLGIFAYRLIGSGTISSGSALDFVHHVKATSRDNAAVVVANPGQLIWHRRGKQAMTQHTWHAIPRETAVSQPMRVDVVRNRVPNNQGIQQHIACVFEEVVDQMTHKDAKIDIIGMGDGALEVVEYLQQDWGKWGGRVDAIAVGASHIWQTDIRDERFGKFWGRRGRAYLISSEDIDTPLTGREGFLCNCYSSGEPSHMELILTSAYKSMLDYFKVVAENPDYEALPQNSSSEQGIEEKDANGGTGEKGW